MTVMDTVLQVVCQAGRPQGCPYTGGISMAMTFSSHARVNGAFIPYLEN